MSPPESVDCLAKIGSEEARMQLPCSMRKESGLSNKQGSGVAVTTHDEASASGVRSRKEELFLQFEGVMVVSFMVRHGKG